MFAMSFKLSKRKIAIFLIVCLTVTSGIFLFAKNKLSLPEDTEASTKMVKKSLMAKTNDDRIVFLQSFGWEINGEPLEVVELELPEEMDEVLLKYNDIQKEQNMDLEKYGGKRVKRYTYVVENHPSGEEDVRANVLVYKDKIVGGDICTNRLDGFMHGFSMGETEANTIIYSEMDAQITNEISE